MRNMVDKKIFKTLVMFVVFILYVFLLVFYVNDNVKNQYISWLLTLSGYVLFILVFTISSIPIPIIDNLFDKRFNSYNFDKTNWRKNGNEKGYILNLPKMKIGRAKVYEYKTSSILTEVNVNISENENGELVVRSNSKFKGRITVI